MASLENLLSKVVLKPSQKDRDGDRSAPVIESDVKLKESPFPKVAEEVKEGTQLKPTETDDRSQPMIEKRTSIKPAPMVALSEEIKTKAEDVVEFANRSSLRRASADLVAELHQFKATLRSAEGTADRSAPIIEDDVTLKENPYPAVLSAISGSKENLKPTLTDDRSQPMIEKRTSIKQAPMVALSEEIKTRAEDFVEFANRSHLREASEGVVAELANAQTNLKAVEEMADRSAPIIEDDVTLKENPYPAVLSAIDGASASLKPTETDDRSQPMIEPTTTIKPALMIQLADEIKGAVAEKSC